MLLHKGFLRFLTCLLLAAAILQPVEPTQAAGSSTQVNELINEINGQSAHSCAIRNDGTLACWGRNDANQANPPAGTFLQVSDGGMHSCGIQSDGTVTCWGSNEAGQTVPPDGSFMQISAGWDYTCGIQSNGTVICWGDNTYGQANPPVGNFKKISSGGMHACGLQTNGTLACWGDNTYHQAEPPAGVFREVSTGGTHSCGIHSDGTLACWGDNALGQATPATGIFRQIGAGKDHTCGIQSNGLLACWGDNTYGQAEPPEGTFHWVKSGDGFSCGLQSNGTLACWGAGSAGQTAAPEGLFGWPQVENNNFRNTCGIKADGTLTCYGLAHGLTDPPAGTFLGISLGRNHACGIQSDGSLACWGNNLYGKATPPGGNFLHVSVESETSCAVRDDGILMCWGYNTRYNLVDGRPEGTFIQVGMGYSHACALGSDGVVFCWGDSSDHRLMPPAGVLFNQLTTGDSTNCGQTSDGSLACWGYNYSCLTQDSPSPECLVLSGPASPPEGTFMQTSCGRRHSCGVQSNGLVDCWGAEARGQSDPPDRLFAQVAAGDEYACGIQNDGALSCWGTPLGTIQPPRIKLLPENLPPYHQDLPYTAQLTASTGTPPYHFSLLSGSLPPGITLSPSGQISGTTEAQNDYTFTVEVQDSSFPISSQVTYQMWINTRPTAAAQLTTAIEDTSLDIELTASDLENDPLSWSVNAPAHGTLVGTAPNLVYTPELNFNGTDSFTFTVNDGYIDSEPATVTITVTPVNDAPLAVDDAFTGLEDAVLIIASPGVLGNDLDNDGDMLHAALLNQPLHGELTLLADGSFSYTPEGNYYGTDTFTYLMMASPGLLFSEWTDEAVVTITVTPVNDAPTPAPMENVEWLAREGHSFIIPEFDDIETDELIYSAQLEDGSPLPSFLSFDPTNRTFSGLPANSHAGSYRIRVNASDGELAATASFTLVILGNEYKVHLPVMLR